MADLFTISFKGLTEIMRKFDAMPAAIRKGVQAELYKGGLMIQNTAKRKILSPGSGRTYKRRTVSHRASAPGQPPASDTGRLASSIAVAILGGGDVVCVSAGGGIVNYAVHLEYGTERMEERPFMRPSLNERLPKIRENVSAAIRKAMKG